MEKKFENVICILNTENNDDYFSNRIALYGWICNSGSNLSAFAFLAKGETLLLLNSITPKMKLDENVIIPWALA